MKKFVLVLLTAVILCSLFVVVCAAEGAAEESITGVQLDWHPENAVANLKYMGLGMLGIFVVVGIVMGITYILNSVTGKKK